MRLRIIFALLVTALAFTGCGKSDEEKTADALAEAFGTSTTVPPPNPLDCMNGSSAELTLDGNKVIPVGTAPLSGTVTVRLLSAETPPSTFTDPFVNEQVIAKGKFFGLRYSLKNDGSGPVQASTVVEGNLFLTDGKRSWHADSATSSGYGETKGDDQPATETAAGFTNTSWAVFDIPADAAPTGVAFQTDANKGPIEQTCLKLP